MLLADVVATSQAVAATRSRKAKTAALVTALRAAGPEEIALAVAYLSGALPQRRTGLGWRSLADLPPPADEPRLTLADTDRRFDEISAVAGPGSRDRRARLTADLFARATAEEQALLRGLTTGELRQGALDGLMLDAIAQAADVPAPVVRRAAMLGGALGPMAVDAMRGGEAALASYSLVVGRPIRPMLASSAPDVAAALDKVGGPAALDCKLDGIRIQVHREGSDVRIWTRSLDEITDRLPEVVAAVRSLTASRVVLDGEAIALGPDGRPRPFQETASRTATHAADDSVPLTPYFFDLLHLDGRDLLDEPLGRRLAALDALVPSAHLTPRLVTDDPGSAQAFFEDLVAAGQEGVVVKRLGAPYDAGRRGAAWVKVKPRHTLDLVVLAVEWGSGRRKGWLSNIHLGALDPDGGFVMLGKTFKGMTDEMLAWQTERFLSLADGPTDGWVVQVRPEQVVEIAFDGLQRSTRYPGGLALRFARVLRYRDDKSAAEADTIEDVRRLAGPPSDA